MQNQAIDIHHHYVSKQLIEETRRHGKALGVDTTEDKGGHALSFAGSKPHRLQPALMDVERNKDVPSIVVGAQEETMAQTKGFYQKEGLDAEIILIAGALGVRAVLGNSVEFSTACGSILAAAARGVPVKLVAVITAKATFDLISEPQIQTFQQLKGNQIGISTRGGTFEYITRLILERNGLNPDKDVTILALGRQDDLHLALKSGRISAAIYSPPRSLSCTAMVFSSLRFRAITCRTIPSVGLGSLTT